MLDKLTLFISHLGHWGYLVIFLIVVLECQAFLGLAMPGESLVLIGGFLAKNGLLDLGDLIVVVAVAATLGDSISYELGRHLGSEWLLKHGRRFGFRQERLTRVKNFLDRHGGKAVFTSHFMHVMRALMPFIAGSCRMRYRWFLIFNAAGCVVWAATFGLIGYLVGAGWELVAKRIGLASAIVGGTLILVIALAWLWHWLERHEAEIRQRGRTIMNLPIVARLGRRFSRPLTFLRNRLSPRGYLGLHLTVGVLLIIGATWLFGGIAEDVMTGDPLTVIDRTMPIRLTPKGTTCSV